MTFIKVAIPSVDYIHCETHQNYEQRRYALNRLSEKNKTHFDYKSRIEYINKVILTHIQLYLQL